MRHENGRSSGFARGLVSVKNPALRLAIFGLMREEIEAEAPSKWRAWSVKGGLS